MQINLYATFRLIAGIKTIHIEMPQGGTVRQVVHSVVEQCPTLRHHWLDDEGDIHAHVHIFVNGHDVRNMEAGLESPVRPTDTLDFFPPVAGG